MTHLELPDIAIRRVDVGGIELSVAETQNEAPAAVLLHGIGMDWRVWQAVARRLSPGLRLIMPDLRGHGASDKPASGYSLADYAGDIERLIEVLQLRAVTLVGSSLGGLVAISVEPTPGEVACRVLVDPPLKRGSGPTRPFFQRVVEIKRSSLSPETQRDQIYEALESDNPSSGKQYLRYMAETWNATEAGVLVEGLHPPETQQEIETALTTIEEPTLIMRANPDRGSVLTKADAEKAAALLPRGEVRYYSRAGHAIHGSAPQEFVADLVNFSRLARGADDTA